MILHLNYSCPSAKYLYFKVNVFCWHYLVLWGFFSMSYYVNLKTNGGELIGYIQIT